jgi:hypothetical protein
MSSRIFRTRLSQPVAAQLAEVCDLAQLSYSDVIRQSLQYVLSHPTLWPEILSQHRRMLCDDMRTPQQAENWQRDYQRLTDPSRLNSLLAAHHQPMPK